MTWTDEISLREPLRSVRLVQPGEPPPPPLIDWSARMREADQAGYERGRRDGEKALSEQLLRQRTELLQVHQGVVESLRKAVPAVVRQTENELLALALEAARKLVAGLPITPELVEAVVREALAQIEETTEFTVHLHPDDLAQLKKINSPLLNAEPGGDPITFHASGEVSRGGCLVHTRFGTLDARRDTKLEQLKKSLRLPDLAPAVAPAP